MSEIARSAWVYCSGCGAIVFIGSYCGTCGLDCPKQETPAEKLSSALAALEDAKSSGAPTEALEKAYWAALEVFGWA